jgi:hypothetical protein
MALLDRAIGFAIPGGTGPSVLPGVVDNWCLKAGSLRHQWQLGAKRRQQRRDC